MIVIELRGLVRCDGYCSTETVGEISRLIRRDVTCSLHSSSTERLAIWSAGHVLVATDSLALTAPRIVDA